MTHTNLMNETAARIFLEASGAYAARLANKSKAALAAMYAADLAEAGRSILVGTPTTHGELTGALLELHYPLGKLNESIHVLYHTPEFPNEACHICTPDSAPTVFTAGQ
jgi:hypothetical protein